MILLLLFSLVSVTYSQSCYGTVILDSISGTINDGSLSANYDIGLDCYYVINIVGYRQITIQFTEFNTDYAYDYLQITSPSMIDYNAARLTGNLSAALPVLKLAPPINLHFLTTAAITGTGWEFNWYVDNSCVQQYSGAGGTVDDGFAFYPVNYYCNYYFYPVTPQSILRYGFVFANLGGGDVVTVYEGDGTSYALTEFSPNVDRRKSRIPGQAVRVEFVTDNYLTSDGWEFEFSNIYCSESVQYLSGLNGTFEDGSGGAYYGDYSLCYWIIPAYSLDSRTILTFSFVQTESGFDYVDVYDGSSTLGTNHLYHFSGTDSNAQITGSYGQDMLITFYSDVSVQLQGFSASYVRDFTSPTVQSPGPGCGLTNGAACSCPGGGSTCSLLPDLYVGPITYAESVNIGSPLMVTVSIVNAGYGPFEILVAQPTVCYCTQNRTRPVSCDTDCGASNQLLQLVQQRIYSKNGNSITNGTVGILKSLFHNHSDVHVDNFITISLRQNPGGPDPKQWPVLASVTVPSFCIKNIQNCTSTSYCTTDGSHLNISAIPNFPFGDNLYSSCGTVQGLGVGFAHYKFDYRIGLDLGATICNGDYALVVEVDPDSIVSEIDKENNVNWIPVTLTSQSTRCTFLSARPNVIPTSCQRFQPSTTLPIAIPDRARVDVYFNITVDFTISFVQVLGISGTHTYPSDLDFYLFHPDGTSVAFEDWTPRLCSGISNNNYYYDFADFSVYSFVTSTCPPSTPANYRPSNPLSLLLNGKPTRGMWRVTIIDTYTEDAGFLNTITLELCSDFVAGYSSFTTSPMTSGTRFTTSPVTSGNRVTTAAMTTGQRVTTGPLTTQFPVGARGTSGGTGGPMYLPTTGKPTSGVWETSDAGIKLVHFSFIVLMIVAFLL